MIPAVPSANPPCQSIVETLGFQSPHVDMSDQIFQTLSAGAELSTEVPYSAIARSFLCAGDSRCLLQRRTRLPAIDGSANSRFHWPQASVHRAGLPPPTTTGVTNRWRCLVVAFEADDGNQAVRPLLVVSK